jgi:serine/threonine protein phosphatase PrpC
VVEALQKVYLTGGLDADIERVKHAIGAANSIVYEFSQGAGAPCVAGSTVVALLLAADRGAVLWAGDSRAYQFRGASTRQLTADHSAPEGDGAITRAVGAEAVLAVDVVQFEVRGGDRFLLCSDGLYSELEPARLWHLVVEGELEAAAERLTAAVLATPARDNFTAIVIGKNPAAAVKEIITYADNDSARDRTFLA